MNEETERELYDILREDNAEMLRCLLAEGLNASEADADKDTLLHRAARFAAADCMRILLAEGAEVSARNNSGETPLHQAADWWKFIRKNNSKSATCVNILLKAGADAEAVADSWIGTPLDIAIKNNNHPEACLLRLAATVQKSPIMQAVWEADTEKLGTLLQTQQTGNLRRLLGKKSAVNEADAFRHTPLHAATLPGRTACLPLLLRAGAKPNVMNKEGITPLMLATLMGNTEAIKILLDAGASTEMADDKHNTPLLHAVDFGYTECVRLLLDAGAKVNHRNHRHDTALHKSVGNADIMQLLIAAGAKLNAEDQNGMTPLAECAHSADAETNRACMRLLIAAGADINHPECRGIPPIYWACSSGHNAMLRLLIEAGADVNLSGQSGLTPLHSAAMGKNTEAVQLLLAAGADPTAPCAEGRTPRDYAKGKAGRAVRDILAEALRARGISLTQGPVMPVKEIRRKLRRKAIVLRSAPAKAPAQEHESSLGRVTRQLPGEEWPTDARGNKLVPLATLCLKNLPALPAVLKKVALVTIYAPVDSAEAEAEATPPGFVLRTYADTAGLVPCTHTAQQLTPCVLIPEPVNNDMPTNPNCGGTEELWDNIYETERALELDYRESILEADYEVHKIGGYPTYTQEEPEIPGGYTFVLQLCTDSTAGLSIGDSGNYYFYYNSRKKDWLVHTDSY